MENLLNLDALFSKISRNDIEQLSAKLGVSEDKTKSALSSSIPLIVSALAKKATSPDEAANISHAVERDHDGSILDNLGSFFSKGDASEGQSILNHVLGSKTDHVAKFVSKDAGVDEGVASKILAMAAPLVMGFLGKRNKETSNETGIGDILGSFLKSSGSNQSQNMIEKLLDKDNDGSVVDDIMDMGKGMLGKLF